MRAWVSQKLAGMFLKARAVLEPAEGQQIPNQILIEVTESTYEMLSLSAQFLSASLDVSAGLHHVHLLLCR